MEHKPTAYTLPASMKAKKLIQSLISLGNYSLTFNITSKLANEDIGSQNKKGLRDIISLFNDMASYIPDASISVELNKNDQIHFHCYFKTTIESFQLVDTFKFHIKKYKQTLWQSHGLGWRLKMIDEITPELLGYVFKDEKRTMEYENLTMGRFKPHHIIIKHSGNIFLGTKVDNENKMKSIKEFIDKHLVKYDPYTLI